MSKEAVNNENKLIKDALKGNQSAYKELYDLYNKALFIICLRYNNNREEAEDRLQDSFIKIFKELHQFDRDKGSFYTWCSRITINTNLELIRKQKIVFDELNDFAINSMKEQYNLMADLELKEIIKEVQKMPPGYRTVFNLYFFEGYNHKEIADQLNISENTSKTQLMKSKNYLKNNLTNDLEIIN
jgi:RNA polymerase sigma factor (sigma-70 family)